jgi:arsenate reductase
LGKLGLTPRQVLRRKGTPYDELGLDDPGKTDDQLIDAILAHPILIERPIVVSAKGARICRPPERLQELLALGSQY